MAPKSDQNGTGTLTESVRQGLLQRIKSGEYAAGEKLPSEIDLARELGVSVAPVRRALTQLVAAGAIVRRPGSGTYVSEPPMRHKLDRWSSYTQELRRAKVDFVTEVTEFGPAVDVPPHVAEVFADVPGLALHYLQRRVSIDGQVKIVTHSWFRRDLCRVIPDGAYFEEGKSLYAWFREQGQPVVFAETELRVLSMGDGLAGEFGVDWGTPVITLQGSAYSRSGQIEFSETFYEYSSFSFTAEFSSGSSS